jgi:hypothetical protein
LETWGFGLLEVLPCSIKIHVDGSLNAVTTILPDYVNHIRLNLVTNEALEGLLVKGQWRTALVRGPGRRCRGTQSGAVVDMSRAVFKERFSFSGRAQLARRLKRMEIVDNVLG